MTEWTFLFRIDHLNVKGDERNLKGVLFTEKGQTPTPGHILDFLTGCGYRVALKDPKHLIFTDDNPADPLEIRIVKVGNDGQDEHDPVVKMIAEQFIRG